MSVAIFLCGFRSSDCCGGSLYRVCEVGADDRFVCRRCHRLCGTVDDER